MDELASEVEARQAIYSAYIANCTMEQSSDWLTTCTSPSTGRWALTINSDIFTNRPTCMLSILDANDSGTYRAWIAEVSGDAVTVYTADAQTLNGANFFITCISED